MVKTDAKKIETVILYPELSYKIIGIAFKIFNEYGFGMGEKFYKDIFAKELKNAKIESEREKLVRLLHEGQLIGKYFLDFVVNNKIVVEFKVRARFGYVHINQVLTYLKAAGYKLAIVIYFTADGVKYRRIVNVK